MSAEKYADLMLEAFGPWLAEEVPRLRTLEHERIARRVEDIVTAVRHVAEKNAYAAGRDAAAAVVRETKEDLERRIAELTHAA